jgi:hypothetical protein
MANTFVQIATYTATGSVATIDFSSIPSTYTDLVLKLSARSSASAINDYCYVQFNNAGYNSSVRFLQGSGSGASSSSESTGYIGIVDGNTATSSTFSSNEIYIPNYAGSTNKSFSVDGAMENNATTSFMHLVAGLWSNTAAINRITLKLDASNNFLQYSTATLYGIKKN